jgi:hypothetical protein
MALDFGLFYEIPVPAPWGARSERDAYHAMIEQAVRGEEVGFTHVWSVEHHFLSEFCRSRTTIRCASPRWRR